ncbi:MAG: glycosyltransferase family 2 protein [Chitinispirillales bacterium]|jgi:GT2 family glycosyltransferase|nr:glycosyltransferase family 2 protein [Chitinispirillales bacterium]
MPNDKKDILISIVIVNYKVPHSLIEALDSLRLAKYYDRSEVIIVDNASKDSSREIITSKFEEVRWIQLKANIGFGKACNIGAEAAGGKYLLLLNPDAVVSADTLASVVEFMEARPSAGLMGPKILNPDGTLQLSCRRSIPTPAVALYYFSGLSYLFPKSRRFGSYHLTYMDEDETAQVEVISGSFMFMRRGLFNEIGGFDKRFFMYGEDIDLCYRIAGAGYEVWYYPETKIVHQKGKSSAKRRVRSRINFYGAMIIFLRKYHGQQGSIFPWWLTWVGIVFLATLNIGAIAARMAAAAIIDLAVLNSVMWAFFSKAASVPFVIPPNRPYYEIMPVLPLIATHALTGFAFVFLFLYNGIYSARQYSLRNLIFSGALSSALVMCGVHFLTPYSRYDFAVIMAASMLFFILWRTALSLSVKAFRGASNFFQKKP